MSSTYGENLKLSIFGQSHGVAIGMTLDGIPAGLPVDLEVLQQFLNRRAPGQNDWSTPRKEEDRPEFLGGILDGFTCGAPIAAAIYNKNTRSGDYDNLKNCPRPGHADYTAQIKYGGFQDAAGGGHFSGRLTAPLCIAGGLCIQWLAEMGIQLQSHIYRIGGIGDDFIDSANPKLNDLPQDFPVISSKAAQLMKDTIAQAKSRGSQTALIDEAIGTLKLVRAVGHEDAIMEQFDEGEEGKIIYAVSYKYKFDKETGEQISKEREANSTYYPLD